MSNKNFIGVLTPQYCTEFMNNAMFMYEDSPHLFIQTDGRTVEALRFSNDPEKPSERHVTIPADHFTGWSSFAFPVLGYRQALDGKLLCYVTRRASVRRGLNLADAQISFHDVTWTGANYFNIDLRQYSDRYGKVPLVMVPSYTPLMQGLKRISAGEIPAFAISADFAVAPHDEVDYLEILFRKRRVGTIDANGNITITTDSIRPSWDTISKGEN